MAGFAARRRSLRNSIAACRRTTFKRKCWRRSFGKVDVSTRIVYTRVLQNDSFLDPTDPGFADQTLYELGDPRAYLTPDCVADFTTVQLAQDGPDRVRISGVRGAPATAYYKVSISYSAGFKALGQLAYTWPGAYRKAQAGACILRERIDRLGLRFDAVRAEYLGVSACHGIPAAEPSPELADQLPEVVLRFGVRGPDRAAVERFTKEIAPLVLNGPPSVTGLGGGRPKVEEVVAYWPALAPKSDVRAEVTL